MSEEVEVYKEHHPVMVREVLEGLNIQANGLYVDATFGRGGHARAILNALNTEGRLMVIDRDPEALEVALSLAHEDPRVLVQHGAFSNLFQFCEAAGWIGNVNGVLMDLGVSSPQLDTKARGFSFRLEGPLDMRMDPTRGLSAADWLNQAKESEIAWVFKTYGEERFHRRIARAIINARTLAPFTSTVQLANVIAKAHPAWEKHKHPATRCFQAIRIFINNELHELSLGLEQALQVLAPEGRLVVISFHSLEDRIVKRFIQKEEQGSDLPARLPILAKDVKQELRRVGRRIKPEIVEIEQNVRARSAVLRIAEKVGTIK